MVKFLVEPDPDAFVMKLVLARCCNNFLDFLLQGLLADAAISLVREFKSFFRKVEWFHELAQCLFLGLAPLHSLSTVGFSSSTAPTIFI